MRGHEPKSPSCKALQQGCVNSIGRGIWPNPHNPDLPLHLGWAVVGGMGEGAAANDLLASSHARFGPEAFSPISYVRISRLRALVAICDLVPRQLNYRLAESKPKATKANQGAERETTQEGRTT